MLEIRKSSDFRHFLYFSDAKLTALHDQLDRSPRKISWRAMLKVAGSGIERTTETLSGPNRYRMLSEIESALRSKDQVGTVDEPRDYFEGELRMRWGLFQDWGRPEGEPPLAYFGGETERTIVGLGGSTRHVLGFAGASCTGSRSVTPSLIGHILDGIGIDLRGWRASGAEDGERVFEAIALANRYLKGPTQILNFVAKTLAVGTTHHPVAEKPLPRPCVLGTPLFVAMAKFSTPDLDSPL